MAQEAAAQARYLSTFTQLRGAAGTGLTRQAVAVDRLEAAAVGVVPPLDTLIGLFTTRAVAAQAAAASAAGQARAIGIATVVLTIVAASHSGSSRSGCSAGPPGESRS